MEVPKCAICGCTQIPSLVQDSETSLYFCNGRGDVPQSHIVYFLREMHFHSFILHSSHPMSKIRIKCHFCETENVFQLGFVKLKDQEKFILICNGKCQLNDTFLKMSNPSTFQPLIIDGKIYCGLISEPSEYKKVSLRDANLFILSVKQKLGLVTEEPSTVCCFYEYESRLQYSEILTHFISAEKAENEKATQPIPNIKIDILNGNIGTIIFHPILYQLVSPSTRILIKQDQISEIGTIIRKKSNFSLEISVSSNKISTGVYTVSTIFSSIPFERQLKALSLFVNQKNSIHPFLADVFLGKTENFKRRNVIHTGFIFHQATSLNSLNSEQKKAVETALSHRFTAIQGPAGTGKTTTIAALAFSFVQHQKKVLVVAHTNVATDFAALFIEKTGVKVVRVNATKRPVELSEISRLCSHSIAKSTNTDEDKIIQDANVVCTTSSTSGCRRMSKFRFEVVIFDEAEMCLDADLLIPVTHGTNQLILVGDHKQLGPVVRSRFSTKGRYSVPLMKRLLHQSIKPKILTEQYRMHPGLTEFPSLLFYGGKLKNGSFANQRSILNPFIKWPNPQIPLIFWNQEGQEEYDRSGVSYYNRNEIADCSVLLQKMYQHKIKASSIGIITPYLAQQIQMSSSLPQLTGINDESWFDELEIASVDAFQGREKDFIILSTVRANNNFDIGFLRDVRRLNVSLTRAKFGLIVIGNAKTFAKHKTWCSFIQHCQEKKVLVQGTPETFVPSFFSPHLNQESEQNENEDEDVGNMFMI